MKDMDDVNNMDEVGEVISCLRKKGLIVNTGALEFIKEKNIRCADVESMHVESLFLTKEMIEAHIIKERHIEKEAEAALKEEEEEDPCKCADAPASHDEELPEVQLAKDLPHCVKVESAVCDDPGARTVSSFVGYFNARYNALKNLLMRRQELKNLVSIGRFNKYSNDRNVSVIGMVTGVSKSKAGNTVVDLEDPTGKIMVIVKDQKGIGEDELLNDEVIGVCGGTFNGLFFADSIVLADVPLPTGIKTVSDHVSCVFISDMHFGSRYYNKGIEERFLEWIMSSSGAQVKYLFICGDIVDGVGIYPGQDSELLVKDIYEQYELFEEFVQKIPGHIQVIICPGNHDVVRIGEPQPAFTREFLPNIYDADNVYLVANPSYVNVHGFGLEEGITVLMYHGYSFTGIVDAVPYLRQKGLRNPQHVMKYVLKRRHLAPPYGATVGMPEKQDSLVISKVPDIFQTGDLHSHAIDNYKGITLISSSTFQDQTPFMDRVGHIANPGKISVVDLHTREARCVDLS